MRRGWGASLGLAVAASAFLPLEAKAQDFFNLSPGELIKGHAKWDNADGCTKCHVIGKGVSQGLCLDCHKEIKEGIEKKRGLHFSKLKGECKTCHPDHKGRAATVIDWTSIGGSPRKFDHQLTGFQLTGEHEKVRCTACHRRKLVSGRTSYTGLKTDCLGCHGNVHQLTTVALQQDCRRCHTVGGQARKMVGSQSPIDHKELTGLPLEGKHATIECTKCHKKARMSLKDKRTCTSCHKSPHGRGSGRDDCARCHAPKQPFKESGFDHAKTARFPLKGKHDTKFCARCHKTKEKPPRNCSGCHADPHAERFGRRECSECHGLGGGGAIVFDHEKGAKLKLTAKHAALKCRQCHRGRGTRDFERFKSSKCRDCHRHENAHKGAYPSEQCTKCHQEGGSKALVFDHRRDSRFALTGFHQELEASKQCKKCHPDQNFRTGKVNCVDCHKDSHQGKLGNYCARCHKPELHFKETATELQHNRISRFKLEGLHNKVKCEKCHPKREYKTQKSACIDCHAKTEPHKTKLGPKCERCHAPVKGAPKFDHASMTHFPRSGAHRKVDCSYCHRAPEGPKKVGWTKSVPKEPVNKLFPVMGKVCADCHEDAHQGSRGSACQSCHSTESFRASRAVHDTGAFRLWGAHDQLNCGRCHQEGRLLAGLGELCQECHREDDVHGNGLGPRCGECHGQAEWAPARFNHASVGFPLRGSHRAAQCRDCHGVGRFQGIPSDCESCHSQQAQTVQAPVHSPELMSGCENCHREASFVPAKRYHPTYPLRGAHAVIDCVNCHAGGSYAGTPGECIACHQAEFADPNKSVNHIAEGFGTDCEECHNLNAWLPARSP